MGNIDLQSEHIGPRLKSIRNALKMTVEEFYSPFMKSFNNGSSIENNKRRLGRRLAKDIISHHGINPAFLSNGTGTMFSETSARSGSPLMRPAPAAANNSSVPYYEVSLATLEPSVYDVFREHAPEYYVDYRPLNDCTAYLPVYGDSMHPRFSGGEIVAVKEVTNPAIILWGEAYLVVTDERANNLITIRLVYQHKHPDKIILRAANPDYQGDTVVEKSTIRKLYLVKGKITRYQL